MSPTDSVRLKVGGPQIEAIQEPESLLGEGEGKVSVARDPGDRARVGLGIGVGARLLFLLHESDQLGEVRHGGGLEQPFKPDLRAQIALHPREELQAEERMSADLEKIVESPHRREAEEILEQGGHPRFQVGARRYVRRAQGAGLSRYGFWAFSFLFSEGSGCS